MCIIAAKPVGIDMPSDDIIANMWYGNSDGAGFMWAEKGLVHIRKGFMTYDDFLRALDDFRLSHDERMTALVMHFRITTHGGTKPANCHPFPIADSVGLLSKLDTKCELGVAHNGIINIEPRKGISDTMEYIISQLAPLHRAVPEFYRDKNLVQMVRNATGSRLAFLNGRGEIYTIGDFIEDKGIKYSNSSFKWSTRRDFAWGRSNGDVGYNYSAYGWADDWDDGWGSINEDDGCFLEIPVTWLDENFGYLTGVKDYDLDGAYALGMDNTVYVYNFKLDALEKLPGACAYSNTGTALRYDPDNVSDELAFYRYTYKGNKKK